MLSKSRPGLQAASLMSMQLHETRLLAWCCGMLKLPCAHLFETSLARSAVGKRACRLISRLAVPAAREELAALFPQADIDAMVQVQSWSTATVFDCFVTFLLCSPVAL